MFTLLKSNSVSRTIAAKRYQWSKHPILIAGRTHYGSSFVSYGALLRNLNF